jgi:hypothetical protein
MSREIRPAQEEVRPIKVGRASTLTIDLLEKLALTAGFSTTMPCSITTPRVWAKK